MSPEAKIVTIQQAQKEGIKAAAKKVTATQAFLRRESYPKPIHPTNKRISFGGVWRK